MLHNLAAKSYKTFRVHARLLDTELAGGNCDKQA
jgi:hypothetical protein